MDCKKRAEIRKLIGKFLSSDLLHYGVLMNFGEDEWGGEDSSFLQRKWGSASLLVKPRRYSGKSPTFLGLGPKLRSCWAVFGEQMQGERRDRVEH